jgi:hypothetical protein
MYDSPGMSKGTRGTIILGTWNILTMLKRGKMLEIAEQFLNIQCQIEALQEIL